MRILLVATAFNSLTQRVFAELGDRGHEVAAETVPDGAAVRAAVRRHTPELVLAPMLKAVIPPDVHRAHTCLVVHPGPVGDRGPSSLDRAVQEGATRWGVTVLQAEEELDAGAVWASASCTVPPVGKSDLYRNEIADAALEALLLAVSRYASGSGNPRRQDDPGLRAAVRSRPYLRQRERLIDWRHDPTTTVLRKLRAADSQPGVRDELLGGVFHLHGGHPEDRLRGRPGDLLATRTGAVCRATADGAVWLPALRERSPDGRRGITLPAVQALGDRLPPLPEDPAPAWPDQEGRRTWADIRYAESGAVGFLRFSFPGGAMSTGQCRRLLAAYRRACERPTSVLVLGGVRDFFSNGIHLGVIEAAADPAGESWANIVAMDDLVEAVLTTTDRLVVAALGGNAAAGGAMLALAADEVWCRRGAVLNPHYRLMGLPGSEYWTCTLPRRVGAETARALTEDALPVSAAAARRLGLVDRLLECGPQAFAGEVAALAVRTAQDPGTHRRVAAKKAALEEEQARKPLAAHRAEELARMRAVFFDPGAPYHALRAAFVRKEPPPFPPPVPRLPARTAHSRAGRAHAGGPERASGAAPGGVSAADGGGRIL
ncbi:enoyl-CoA hydratase-related protein [Streptomyces sp. JJ36]|uniref:enoyl-CoA hydratase-related protein n=1 Tax=Streptomyces sp. JJ36 TaxID=2736645 RepID=UPI001F0262B3|nr:enoyl-CoA hydratase-related protein [Streptomyces sp. JJ36]MCF6521921.1 hydrogenase maturation protein [Streptomyces sp. JJ36]